MDLIFLALACDVQLAASFKWQSIDLFSVCDFITIKLRNQRFHLNLSLSA